MSGAGAGTGTNPVEDDAMNVDGDNDHVTDNPVNPVPEGNRRNRPSAIPATPFAGAYESLFTIEPPQPSRGVMNCLAKVNCSYLSNPDQAPTLEQLKQHTQSLANLIKQITISTQPAVINNASQEENDRFLDGESFDFLNDLNTPYMNDERHHRLPLNRFANRLEPDPLDAGSGHRNICPLYEAYIDQEDKRAAMPPSQQSLPFASHQALIEHANETLELIDHEYSAKGGLLSILPTTDQKEERASAESTLLGQLILYVNRLVLRLHDLERLYANAMDVLAGEALVPHQTLNLLGPKGRKEREVVYPQDRFVLANAGDDVWNFLQREFQHKETLERRKDAENRRLGVTGQMIWDVCTDGTEISRGMVAIDVNTRYYRVRGDPLKTIFVIPAHQDHPNTKVTREIECQPTVVSVVKPTWPIRASMYEKQNREKLDRVRALEQDNSRLKQTKDQDDSQIDMLRVENDRQAQTLREKDEHIKKLTTPTNKARLDYITKEITVTTNVRNEAARQRAAYQRALEQFDKDKTKRDGDWAAREAQVKAKEAAVAHNEEVCKERMKLINEEDQNLARASQDTAAKLRAVWTKQIQESQELITILQTPEAQALFAKLTADKATQDRAKRDAELKVSAVLGPLPTSTTGDNGADGGGGGAGP